ncbi:MarR family winged helix-turn-helix transcriptional regulator [Sphingopyxis indica]|uniref:MarR family winged helix-turn-helix transcriptional regulator n=1 Tax=Sphingopyxis indica TaxID=436663 RepID=UPI002939090D|nr:MarR family winged helix-turn-helix transcriptional regulator [Sphingopyxis indica]
MIYIDVNRSSHEEAVEPGRADSPEPARFPTHFDDERPLLVAVAAPPSQSVGEGIAGMRPAATVSPQGAADHIRAMARPGIIWLRSAESLDDALLSTLCTALAERRCSLIGETTLAALDRIDALFADAIPTQWLVDADPLDRAMAVAAMTRVRPLEVNDVTRDEAMARIDRLQEEVARIARLLGDFAGPGGLPGTPHDHGGGGHRSVGYPGQVRAPVRDFALAPRSFESGERALDRQRAKNVRRMLRQRRMREQYFPADLFADPAWDMLLDLYAARLEHRPVSVSSLCIAAAVPATTALRWIKTMTEAGLFVREADPQDGRRIFIALAEGACDAMARYFEALEE